MGGGSATPNDLFFVPLKIGVEINGKYLAGNGDGSLGIGPWRWRRGGSSIHGGRS